MFSMKKKYELKMPSKYAEMSLSDMEYCAGSDLWNRADTQKLKQIGGYAMTASFVYSTFKSISNVATVLTFSTFSVGAVIPVLVSVGFLAFTIYQECKEEVKIYTEFSPTNVSWS